jgi:hypothetical protein
VAALWVVPGVALSAFGAVDVFLTVLHYENPGLLAIRIYRLVWNVARLASTPLPVRVRTLTRSMVAPAMVVFNLGGWLGLQIIGFALIYYPGIARGSFGTGQTGRSFGTSVSFSTGALTSLSFSDLEPHTLAYHSIAAAETLVGLGILTLAISYVLNLYRVLQDQGVMAELLLHHSGRGDDPIALLESHFSNGHAEGLGTLVRELDRHLTEHHEGMRRYPVVWYFNTRRYDRSLPYIFWFVGSAAASLRWGLPTGHPATREPWLPGLLTGYDEVLQQIGAHFLPTGLPQPPDPQPLAAFAAAANGGATSDRMIVRFLEVERRMCELADAQPEVAVDERYGRYRAWAQFVGLGHSFVKATSHDLGLDTDTLYAARPPFPFG